MWNNFLSIVDVALAQVLSCFVAGFTQHPGIGACFLLTVAVLTVLLWIEVFREDPGVSKAADPFENVRPIRLRR